MIVGITGPSGAGKGCVTRVFENRGFDIIDADRIAREIVMPGQPTLAALTLEFGPDILCPDGSLNRRALAATAFASRQRTDALNRIMHGDICCRMRKLAALSAQNGNNCVFDAPLLIESGLIDNCDVSIAVIAPQEIRIHRLTVRDGLTESEIRSRLSRQHHDGYYTSRCDYTIINDGDFDSLIDQAGSLADRILLRDSFYS